MSDNLFLFANNNGGQAENNGSYRLYDMKIEGDTEGVKSGVNYVDYLEGDGASYIDTGIIYNSQYKCELIYDDATIEAWERYFGGYNFYLERRTDNEICNFFYGTKVYERIFNYSSIEKKIKIYIDKNKIYKNNELILEMNPIDTIVIDKFSIFIFGSNNGRNKVSCGSNMNCYSFKIWDTQNNLLIHLRPCLDTQGVPCMYDEVSKKYFYNKGTGTFKYKKTLREFQPVLDSNNIPCLLDKTNKKYYYNKGTGVFDTKEKVKYKKLKYIQGDGNSWITTNFTVSSTQGYDMEVKCEGIGNTMIFGKCAKGDISDGNFIYGLGYRENLGWSLYGSCDSHTHEGLVHTLTNLNSSNDLDTKLNLFGFGNYVGTSKIYYAKLYDENDNLVFNAIPVLDENNTPCMYDLISEQFFYNQGTGTFGYEIEELDANSDEYTEIEYIESTGTQYIDTEVVTTDNTDIDMTCRACDYNDNPTVNNSYILNGLVINDNKYNYKDTDTTVQPNLVASSGATLTMGTTNMNQLSDDDIEVATNNGWSIV